MSRSGVISPPGMRGTTEYVPFFWMLARKWSLVSCRAARSPERTCPPCSDARIEATTGLQTSQPRPLPCSAMSRENVVMPRTRTISNSSGLLWSKCSHSALPGTTPSAARIETSAGTQLPQLAPARVHLLTPATSVRPCSAMAALMAALVTLLQEHTCASPGKSAPETPAEPVPANSSSLGGAVSSLPTIGRSRS